jgi:hypothetical protein
MTMDRDGLSPLDDVLVRRRGERALIDPKAATLAQAAVTAIQRAAEDLRSGSWQPDATGVALTMQAWDIYRADPKGIGTEEEFGERMGQIFAAHRADTAAKLSALLSGRDGRQIDRAGYLSAFTQVMEYIGRSGDLAMEQAQALQLQTWRVCIAVVYLWAMITGADQDDDW